MANDLISLLKTVFPSRDEAPALVLVGHSMVRHLICSHEICDLWDRRESQGGAVVAEACNRIQDTVADVLGVTVIDVVEGESSSSL